MSAAVKIFDERMKINSRIAEKVAQFTVRTGSFIL